MAFKNVFRCFSSNVQHKLLSPKLFILDRCLSIRYFRIFLNMNTVYFLNDTGDDTLHIQLFYHNELLKMNKTLVFQRKMSESIDKFLFRLNGKLENAIKIKNKKNKKLDAVELTNAMENINTFFHLNNEPLPTDAVFQDILNKENESDLKLRIIDSDYKVLFNYPTVLELNLPEKLRMGCPIFPKKLELKCCDESECQFLWYKKLPKSQTWLPCGEGYSYLPKEEDLYHFIKLICIPTNGTLTGPKCEVLSETPIEDFFETNLIKKRHVFTQNKTEKDEIRVVTYNILADIYTNTKEAKSTLFTYCNPSILDIEYRMGLILMELKGYNADIICLQEVSRKFFKKNLNSYFINKGFNGIYHEKEGSREGCAFFFHTDKFKIIKGTQHIFNEELQENPMFHDIKQKVIDNKKLIERISGMPTQIQIGVLECLSAPDHLIVLGNTHLYFHPDADHIRLLQGIMAFRLILQTVKDTKDKNPGKTVSVIFCGDFNSVPSCGIYKFITECSVDDKIDDWKSNPEEVINNVSFSHSLPMASACGTPTYTNYTQGFKECIDYIFYQTDSLTLKSCVPLPSEEDLSKQVAIPSAYFPSDHIALIADLKFKSQKC